MTAVTEMDKRLIEDYLPIEAISKEASREKSVRKGHISTLHLWWARRNIFPGNDGFNAAQSLRPAGIDLHHASVVIGAAQKSRPERIRAHDVGGIRRAAGNFAFAFDATEHTADNACFHHLFSPLSTSD